MGVQISPVRYVRIEDADIAYQVYGDGPIDVLVLPGGIWDIDMIRDWPGGGFLEHLAALGCRVIAYDRRGMGRSDRPLQPLSMDGLLDDISAVLDAVGSKRAAFFAMSEGGPMSLLYAAANPDRVTHLVLWGSFARYLDPGDGSGAIAPETLAMLCELAPEHWGTGLSAPMVLPSMLDDPAMMAHWERFERAAHTPRSMIAELELASRIDLSGPATAVRCPTLVLHATGDRLVPVSAGRYLAGRIEGSRRLRPHVRGPWRARTQGHSRELAAVRRGRRACRGRAGLTIHDQVQHRADGRGRVQNVATSDAVVSVRPPRRTLLRFGYDPLATFSASPSLVAS